MATSLHGAFFAHAAFAKSTHTRCVWTQAPGLLHALAHHPITTNLPGFALKGQNSDYMLQANPSLNAYGTPAQQLERIAAFEQGCRTLLAALDTIALPAPGAPISTWVHDPNGVSITSMYRPSASAWSIQAAAASIAMGSIGLSDTPPDNPFDLVPNLHRI